MNVVVRIPRVLRHYCDNRLEVQLTGQTVRDVLDELRRSYPQLYGCICNETGAVRQHVNLFINDDLLRDRQTLATRLRDGDIVSVFQAVSGG